jgi:hypothetical protein
MAKCAICSKELNVFNTAYGKETGNRGQLCINCLNGTDKNSFDKVCAICGQKLTMLNTGIAGKLKTGEKLCLSCVNRLDGETVSNLKNLTKKDFADKIEGVQQKIAAEEKRKNSVIEYKRTCLQCGKVWYSLASREKHLEKEKNCNNCNMCASAASSANGNSYSWGTWTQAKRNEHALESEIERLKQCPNCLSTNYKEKEIYYEKK